MVSLLEAEIKGTLPRSGNKDLTSSGWPEASQILGYPHQSTVKANLEADTEIDKGMMQRERSTRTDAAPINNFMQWFQAISANMNSEAQKRVLAASRKVASSVFADVGDDGDSSAITEAAPAWGYVRRVEYSVEMAEIGFPA